MSRLLVFSIVLVTITFLTIDATYASSRQCYQLYYMRGYLVVDGIRIAPYYINTTPRIYVDANNRVSIPGSSPAKSCRVSWQSGTTVKIFIQCSLNKTKEIYGMLNNMSSFYERTTTENGFLGKRKIEAVGKWRRC